MQDRFFVHIEVFRGNEFESENIYQTDAKSLNMARNFGYINLLTKDDWQVFQNVESIEITDTEVKIMGQVFKRDEIDDLTVYHEVELN